MKTYSKGLHAANLNTVEYALRLRQDISHRSITNSNYGRDGRPQRLKCELYCYKCIKGLAVGKHYRESRTTSKICVTCKVPLCANCNEIYHTAESLPLPQCVTTLKKHNRKKNKKSNKAVNDNKENKELNEITNDNKENN